MEEQLSMSSVERERKIEQILNSNDVPIGKVQRLMSLGLEEEEADEIVGTYQIGQVAPVYYEQLQPSGKRGKS